MASKKKMKKNFLKLQFEDSDELKEIKEQEKKMNIIDKREVYKQELMKISDEKGLTAQNVVDEARSENSLLHECFDWNDATAGEKFRLAQARYLINSINVTIITPEGNKQEVALFENVVINGGERMYKSVYEIIDNQKFKEQIIDKALDELIYWKNKHKTFSEFKTIFKEIEKTERRLKKNGKSKQSKENK